MSLRLGVYGACPADLSDPVETVDADWEVGGSVATLEDLKPEKRVDGLVVGSSVTVLATSWHGSETLEVVYRTADGAVDNRLLSRSDENRAGRGSVATCSCF